MPRMPKLFGRKQADAKADSVATLVDPFEPGDPSLDSVDAHSGRSSAPDSTLPADAASPQLVDLTSLDTPLLRAEPDERPRAGALDLHTAERSSGPPVQGVSWLERSHGAGIAAGDGEPSERSNTLIGGMEAGLVPVIPDTLIEVPADTPDSSDLDEETIAAATIEALGGACELMVSHINKIRRLQDGGQIVSGLIGLVGVLDARYADDWGVIRKNGLEDVLAGLRAGLSEEDQFLLESLETGRGSLSAEAFLRDLRTIAVSDRPRMIIAYVNFLLFVIKSVLAQYLHPLKNDRLRVRDATQRLDYLFEGIQQILIARVAGSPRQN